MALVLMLPFVCIYVSIFLCFTNIILVRGGKHTCNPSSGKAEAGMGKF